MQRPGAVREDDGKGGHTTTGRSLHRVPGGGLLMGTILLSLLDGRDVSTIRGQVHWTGCGVHQFGGGPVEDFVNKPLSRTIIRRTVTRLDEIEWLNLRRG